MNPAETGAAPCPYDASPDAALAAVRTHEGPILVDLDETLYLRNSTEDFIDCARPGLLALLLLRSLDLLKPWRLTGGVDTRDTWRTCAISFLFPWTRWYWRARVRFLAEYHVNRDLKAALMARARPFTILTTGFESVVRPLLAAMGFANAPLIAARMSSFADRRKGKLHMATRELGAETVSRCLVVTDSVSDLDVLHSCERPLRTIWPQASYRHALARVYLPGQYISQIKRPGQPYIWGSIIQEDYIFWLLSSIGMAINPTAHFIGLLFLLLSFWAIYERGYVDNDFVAFRHESDPKLSANFGRVLVATPAVQPWIWALLSGAAGVAILHPDQTYFMAYFALWTAILILTYFCFICYNRLDKNTRVWLYPLLQFWRIAAFTAIVPVEPAGAVALGALLMSRLVPYMVYRLSKASDWPDTRSELLRLIIFVILSVLIASSVGLSMLLTWSALALLLWIAYRARRDICAVFDSARRLDRSRRPSHQGREPASKSQ
jgi:hypothetical protein